MTEPAPRSVIWDEPVIDRAALYLKDDRAGLTHVFAAFDALADDPAPANSVPLGSPKLRRLHIGRYRVMYEITSAEVVTVIHLGRVGS